MDTIAKKNDSWRDILKDHMDTIIVATCAFIALGILVWFVIGVYNERAEQKALVEASRFEVQGVIENVREEHKIVYTDFLWMREPSQQDSLYISIDGTEYKVNVNLEKYEFLNKGQEVKASGEQGRIDSLSISK